MNCPHCTKNLRYKERGDRRCSQCRREFAFEPKGHSLALHDNRFRHMVKRLSENGELRYTAEQLRHALARKPVAAQPRPEMGCVVIPLGIATVVAAAVVSEIVSSVAGMVILVAGAVAITVGIVRWRKRPFYPKIPMSPGQFQNEVIDRWRYVYHEPPQGLILPGWQSSLGADARPTEKLEAVVVSPERDVLTCLLANDVPRRLNVGLLPVGPPFDAWEQAVLDQLRKDPELPVLLLHDASAAGAFLARDLPLLLRLDPHHRVYDLGLNPKRSINKKRLVVGEPLYDALRARLDAELAEVSETVRPIRRGRARLTAEEIKWLADGFSSPLLAISPGSLYKRLVFALDKIEAKRSKRKKGDAKQAAESVGFLTWPA